MDKLHLEPCGAALAEPPHLAGARYHRIHINHPSFLPPSVFGSWLSRYSCFPIHLLPPCALGSRLSLLSFLSHPTPPCAFGSRLSRLPHPPPSFGSRLSRYPGYFGFLIHLLRVCLAPGYPAFPIHSSMCFWLPIISAILSSPSISSVPV